MTSNRIYVVDAFTDTPFGGNPAAVLPLLHSGELTDGQMQKVANEMNHAETAFVAPMNGPEADYSLRWFTPTVEVDLCGHATLAAAHTLWEIGSFPTHSSIRFQTRSGILVAHQEGEDVTLDFPAETPWEEPLPVLPEFLGTPSFTGRNRMDWFVVLSPGIDIRSLQPDMGQVQALGLRGLIVTTTPPQPTPYDFVSRFFAPQSGVPEDPVTGSAHCCLGPYWAEKLGKPSVLGFQASQRGGSVGVTVNGARVLLHGKAVTALEGILKCI